MIHKGLLKLLAIVAIFVVGSSTAIPVPQSCDKIEDCKTCLERTEDCAWNAGKDIPGCVAKEECRNRATCFIGEAGASELTNEYTCGNTCNMKLDCKDCMKTDITGKKKTDCAWFIRGNEDPRCIYRKRCDDKGFEGGKCIRGKKKDSGNNKQCARKNRDLCPRLKNCGKCLAGKKGQACAWTKNDGTNTYSCVAEDKCQGSSSCIYGSTTFNVRKRCRAEKKKDKPKPDPPVGIEKCEDFHGLCTDCLLNGCAWINDHQECLDSCDIIADIGCDVLVEPEEEGKENAIDTFNRRSLLEFDNPASEKCYDLKLQSKNKKLCSEAKQKGGCDECVKTQLYTAPGDFYIHPPTCHWLPNSEVCQPSKCNWWECGQDTCSITIDPPIVINPPPPPIDIIEPPPKLYTEFPELLNKTAKYAFEYLNSRYGEGTLNIIPVTVGDDVIENIENDRVWLWVKDASDKESIIVEVPKVQ